MEREGAQAEAVRDGDGSALSPNAPWALPGQCLGDPLRPGPSLPAFALQRLSS